jgi:sulfoxide reductase heme-binding subunit YedZ
MPFLRESTGQWSPLKIVAFAGAIAPALWIIGRIFFDDLGARPVTVVLHFCGDWTVRFILIALTVTPARRLFNWGKLIVARRTLGVAAFCYALCHFSLYIVDQKFDLKTVASEIALRFYLTIGFTALIGLIALGATSTDAAVRRLKHRWGTLHRAVYPISVLAITHFAMQKKLEIYEPTWMAGLLFWLLAYRVVYRLRGATTLISLIALAFGSALFTMLFEAAWYGVLTGVPPSRVLLANFMFDIELRPAWWVLGVGLLITLAHVLALWLWPKPAPVARPQPQPQQLKPAE